jgi:hypothetical protein
VGATKNQLSLPAGKKKPLKSATSEMRN